MLDIFYSITDLYGFEPVTECLQGAGKTSLFRALLDLSRQRNRANLDIVYSDMHPRKVVEGGVCYLDSVGVNLQVPF